MAYEFFTASATGCSVSALVGLGTAVTEQPMKIRSPKAPCRRNEDMKKRIQLQHIARADGGGSPASRTGEHCPADGWWAPLDDETAAHFIAEGSVMPSVGGNPAIWKLVRHLQRIQRPSHDFPPRGFALDSI